MIRQSSAPAVCRKRDAAQFSGYPSPRVLRKCMQTKEMKSFVLLQIQKCMQTKELREDFAANLG